MRKAVSNENGTENIGYGCANCRRVYAQAKKAIEELGVNVALEKVENINEIISFGY